MSVPPLLAVTGLHAGYGRIAVVDGVSFELADALPGGQLERNPVNDRDPAIAGMQPRDRKERRDAHGPCTSWPR